MARCKTLFFMENLKTAQATIVPILIKRILMLSGCYKWARQIAKWKLRNRVKFKTRLQELLDVGALHEMDLSAMLSL